MATVGYFVAVFIIIYFLLVGTNKAQITSEAIIENALRFPAAGRLTSVYFRKAKEGCMPREIKEKMSESWVRESILM